MSIVRPALIANVADSLGITSLAPDVAAVLGPDAEFRLREVVQEALKFMRHSKRGMLTADHLAAALAARNAEPLRGVWAPTVPVSGAGGSAAASAGSTLAFRKSSSAADTYYLDDPVVELQAAVNAPLPRPPTEPAVVPHWLAIEGVQPTVPENAPPPGTKRGRDVGTVGAGAASGPSPGGLIASMQQRAAALGAPPHTHIIPAVEHVLSAELQLYFDRVTSLVLGPPGPLQSAALASLAGDPGLHQLLPYLVKWLADTVASNLRSLSALMALASCLRAVLSNPHLEIEPYLHAVMPTALTLLVAKRLCATPAEDHWALRDVAAGIIAQLCRRFRVAYPAIQPRVTTTLLKGLMDASKPLATHYGAVAGLAALGTGVTRSLLLPALPQVMAHLRTTLGLGAHSDEKLTGPTGGWAARPAPAIPAALAAGGTIATAPLAPPVSYDFRFGEAARVRAALLRAAGMALREVTLGDTYLESGSGGAPMLVPSPSPNPWPAASRAAPTAMDIDKEVPTSGEEKGAAGRAAASAIAWGVGPIPPLSSKPRVVRRAGALLVARARESRWPTAGGSALESAWREGGAADAGVAALRSAAVWHELCDIFGEDLLTWV